MRNVILTIALSCSITMMAQQRDTRMEAQLANNRAEECIKIIFGKQHVDSMKMCRTIMDAVSNSLKCDEYDCMPQRNGMVKTRFVNQNHKRLTTLHQRLLTVGDYFQEHGMIDEAREAYVLYMNAAENRLLKNLPDNSGLAAYALAEISIDRRDFKQADRYANIALAYDNSAQLAAEVKAQCMRAQMITPQDSARYLAVINKLYETDPNNDKYFAWIMQFYDRPQQRHKMEYFVDRELENNPNSIVPWILKGEIAMKAARWEEAVDAYQHADEIDPSNVAVAFNIGVCLTNRAADFDKERRQRVQNLVYGDKGASLPTAEEDQQIKQWLTEARAYLERVRGRDPKRNKVDWVKPLYMVYTLLNEKVKAEELEPIVNGFANKQ